jgi:hypothetical protein
MMRLITCLAFLALIVLPTASQGQGGDGKWGNIKGQIIADGDFPPPAAIEPTNDKKQCLEKGPLFTQTYVIDKQTKGVKWVFVALVDPKNPNTAIPVHPKVKAALPAKVSVDQPCCMFEPRVLGVVAGQIVEAKNSAPIPHNVKTDGGTANPSINQIIPPGKSLDIEGWKASTTAVPLSCTIHPWMTGWIRVYPHPYFAITDDKGNFEIKNAPAGDWNLVIWQEGEGYINKGDKKGKPVKIEAEKTTDLGTIKMTPNPKN